MAIAPLLTARRLDLRPFGELFLSERYVGWLNDPQVVRFSELRHARHTLEACRAYLRSFESSAGFYWAIIVKEEALGHIGNISVHVDVPNQVADIGILLGEKQAWGQGYGSEAWGAVCTFLLTLPNVRKITAGAMASNAAMVRMALKSGMVEESRRPDHFLLNGQPEAAVYWTLMRCAPSGSVGAVQEERPVDCSVSQGEGQ